MKKVQVPVILPVLLTAVIVVLLGVLTYSALSGKSEGEASKKEDKPQQVQEVVSEINAGGVYSSLTEAKSKLEAVYVSSDVLVKGQHLNVAAGELKTTSAYCGAKEESLRRFSADIGKSLEIMGDKLLSGGSMTDVDIENLSEIVKAVDNAVEKAAKAIDESNNDYFRGEFSLPVIEVESGQQVGREKADEAAKAVLDSAMYKEENDKYYSYGDGNYLLEVSKTDGSVMYRAMGYEPMEAELTEQRLKELANAARTMLKNKGFGDTVLFAWQYAGGEVSMMLYPVAGDTVYMNAPFGVVMSISDATVLGLKTSTFAALNVEDNGQQLAKLKDEYKNSNYIVKAINQYGLPCYAVSYDIGGVEYIALQSIENSRELGLFKMANTIHGRVLEKF